MPNILITGGAGFIGKRLALSLRKAGHGVAVFDNLHPQVHPDPEGAVAELRQAGAQFTQGDVLDGGALTKSIIVAEADIVIHLAAETGTGQSYDLPVHYCDVNVTGTARLIEAIRAARSEGIDVGRVILAGSRAVYGEGACRDVNGQEVTAVPRLTTHLATGDFAPKDAKGRPLKPIASRAETTVPALWPEELITAGRLRRGSLLHRAIVAVERACLARAAAVVSLTHAAKDHLRKVYPLELADQRVVVIPTCADLARFTPRPARASGPLVHGCIGTILSGWFRTDWLAAWLGAAAAHDPAARFEIVTRDDANRVRAALHPANELSGRLKIGPRPSEDMPDAVRGHDLSVMFYSGGEASELGRSPTRMAEVLGCGLPVVANEGVGDVAEIVRKNNIGVIVKGLSKAQMEEAFEALQTLMQDPDLPARCRATAETVFSLDTGTEAYRALYAKILGQADLTMAPNGMPTANAR